jgi:outer membrane receptor protein involved in Fe transport
MALLIATFKLNNLKVTKMKLKLLIMFVLVLVVQQGFGQAITTLKGVIKDNEGTTVVGANIYIVELELGTVSDVNGMYQLKDITPGNYTVKCSYIGYHSQEQKVNIQGPVELNFTLSEGIMLEGLMVTAQKREQSIVEIPAAMSSLSANFIDNLGFSQVDGLADYIPGMQMQIQSPNNPGFVIRGITSDDGASNIEPRVSVFQDGVSISKSRGSVVEVFDMERVEVMKGPQGTLFGRGAEIGAVHFIQQKAKNENSGEVSVGAGEYAYRMGEGNVNVVVAEDKLFMRLAGIYKYRDGYIRNLSGGRLNGKDTKAIRGSFHYQASKNTNFDLIYNYQHDTPPGTAFKSGTYAPAGGDTKPWTTADLDAGDDLGLDRTVWGATLNGKHYFSPNTSLTSITAYREFDSYESFDADGTVAPALWMAEECFGKQLSQELRLNLKLGDKFEGFAGANYFYEDGYQCVPFTTNEQSYAVLISSMLADALNTDLEAYLSTSIVAQPLVTDGVANTVSTLNDLLSPAVDWASTLAYYEYIDNTYGTDYYSDIYTYYALCNNPLLESHSEYYKNYGTNSSFEFFADGTYKITDKLKVTAGLRLTLEKIKSAYEAGGDQSATLGFATSAGNNILFMPTDKMTHEETFTAVVGRLAFNYSLKDNMDGYLNLSRGRRPNVIEYEAEANGDYTSSYEVEVLDEEIVYSYELGIKGLALGQSLYFDFAAFYYDYENFQTSSIDETTNQLETIDAGNASALGIEYSTKWQMNSRLNVFANYAYIKAEFDDEDADGNEQEYAGNTFRLTPEHSFGLGCELNLPISKSVNAFIRPNYNYKSAMYFDEDNDEDLKQEAYGIMNARAGIVVPKHRLTFSVFANNLFNEKYIIDAGNTGDNFGIPTFIAGAPRLAGAEVNIKF